MSWASDVESSLSQVFLRETTVTVSREHGRLHDPRPGKGEPVPVEASGAHLDGATSLLIAPQATWIFRGDVRKGAAVSVDGNSYTTTADAEVDTASPDTLSLPITPGLDGALSGAEVVTITEAVTTDYDARKTSDRQAQVRGWSVSQGSAVYVVEHPSPKVPPEPGMQVTAPISGSILMTDGSGHNVSTIQIGAST